MSTLSSQPAFTITAIDADGCRHAVHAVSLELALTDGSGIIQLDAHPHEAFAGQLVLRAEPRADLHDRHLCVFNLRPGACNVLHLALETLPLVEMSETQPLCA